jgi:serine/threonine protein kinase
MPIYRRESGSMNWTELPASLRRKPDTFRTVSLRTDTEGFLRLRPGVVFADRFEIDRPAGSGGMATVYRARDRLTAGWVALKLLMNTGTGARHSERFAREAQLLSELRHPHIVGYAAHGETPEGQRFLAMQWLDGQDLAARLASGPVNVRDALAMTARIAEALSVAHQHGVVHRDLKPTNLFLPGGDFTQVKLLDFGIARRIGPSRRMTRTGMVIGTPEYMAPEQARGERELSPAADLFSLGCVLYECLTGEPPFVADHIAAVLVRILFEDPMPVARRRPGLPASICTLLDRLLEKVPERRLNDAMSVVHTIAALGELPDLPLVRMPAASDKTPLQTDSEQVLLSLVLAISPQAAAVDSATLQPPDIDVETARHQVLLASLREFGAQADLLIGGALVFTVPQMRSAQDQAAQAARLACLVKDHWPEAQVVVVTGKGSRNQGGLSGEVLDRAWRLIGQSQQGGLDRSARTLQIRIDSLSAGLLQARFELAPLSSGEEGFVLGSERLEADTGRLLLGKPTPCVGRERELATLESVYHECKEEQVARAVLVLGPPGLGKSRLRHEFLRRLQSRGVHARVLLGRGDPLKTKSAYGLLGDALRKQLDLREGQDPSEQRARILQRIAAAIPESEALRVTVFLGEICGVAFPDEESPLIRAARQDPRIMRDQVERAWLDSLQLMRADEPLLLILEDLHWSDALTVMLVGAALRRLHNQGFMVLALARPEVYELHPDLWSGLLQNLPLHPLPHKAGERLVRQVLDGDTEPAQITRLVELSAGNPLFLEELIRAEAEGKAGELPETVMAMIQSRVGRFAPQARRVLRAASVLGEVFWEDGVERLLAATHSEERLPAIFDELVREESIEQAPEGRFTGKSQYRFRHALLRDAVYALASEEEKLAWHAAAGRFLEEAGEHEAILLADHYRLGRDCTHAIQYYLRAAEQAYDAGNMEATLQCTERGLSCGAAGEERGALLSLKCLVNAFREQDDQILSAGLEALSLLRPGSKPYCQVLYPLAFCMMFIEPDKSVEFAAEWLPLEPEPDAVSAYCILVALLASALLSAGQRGPFELMRQRAHLLLPRLTQQDHNSSAHLSIVETCHYIFGAGFPYRSSLNCQNAVDALHKAGNRPAQALMMTYLGEALVKLGQRVRGIQVVREAALLAEQTNDSIPLGLARSVLARLLAESPHLADREQAQQLAHQATKTRLPVSHGWAYTALAQLAQSRGDLPAAEADARTGCQMLAGYPPYAVSTMALLSRILRQQGKLAESQKVCAEAVQQFAALGLEPLGILELHVELAEVTEHLGDHAGSRQAALQALLILRRRFDDIPESDLRAPFLREVPENAQLLKLASAWGLDTSAFSLVH